MKKLLCVLLAVCLLSALAVPALAADPVYYTVKVNCSGPGIYTASSEIVPAGGAMNIIFIPDPGAYVGMLIVDGKEVLGREYLTITDINANHTVAAFFYKDDGSAEPDTPTEPAEPDTPVITPPAFPFEDVVAGAWYYDAAHFVYSNGLMNGTAANAFTPDGQFSRAMLAAVLYRMAGSPAVTATTVSDVPADSWFAAAAAWCMENKVIDAVSGSFLPERIPTREETAQIFYNFAALRNYDMKLTTDLAAYTDVSKVSAEHLAAVKWAAASGYMTGVSSTELAPQSSLTRAQIAQILVRFFKGF